jgi:hypothetical protein
MAVVPQVEQFGRPCGGAIRVDRDRCEPSRTSPL